MSDREEILGRIREALGRASSPAKRSRVDPMHPASSSNDSDVLASKFCSELEKIGGQVVRVESEQEARSQILRLIREKGAAVVAASDSEIGKWLEGQALEVVPSLAEFATRSSSEKDGDLAGRYKQVLIRAEVGITGADYAIAETGTLVLTSGDEQHRLISLLPPVHVCLLEVGAILADFAELVSRVGSERYSVGTPPRVMTLITGSSRTADIELTLTLGVHGPREVWVLLRV